MVELKYEYKKLIDKNDFEGLARALRKEYGKFNIPKSIKKVRFDPDQEKTAYAVKMKAVIVTYIHPLDFFKYKTTNGKDIRYWLDFNSLIHNLDRLKSGKTLYTPVIRYDPFENKNVWHEGRHRCYAYYIAGVRKIPLLVKFEHNQKPIPIDEIKSSVLNKFKPYKLYKRKPTELIS